METFIGIHLVSCRFHENKVIGLYPGTDETERYFSVGNYAESY